MTDKMLQWCGHVEGNDERKWLKHQLEDVKGGGQRSRSMEVTRNLKSDGRND